MESAPSKTENDAETSEASSTDKKDKKTSKKSQTAGALGAIVIKPEDSPSFGLDVKADKENFWKPLKKSDAAETAEAAVETAEETSPSELVAAAQQRLEQALPPEITATGEVDEVYDDEVLPIEQELVRAAPVDDDEAVQAFRDKILTEGKDSETSFQETLQEFDMAAMPEVKEAAAAEKMETDEPQELTGEAVIFSQQPEAGISEPALSEAEPESDEADPAQAVPAGSTPASPAPTVPAGSGGAGRPPLRPTGQAGAGGLPPFPGGPVGFNAMPPLQPNAAPVLGTPEASRNDGDLWTGVLVGGIVGYLVGRRRGRIKTERRLLPVQKKLEKQVAGLQKELAFKELRLHKAMRQKTLQAVEAGAVAAAAARPSGEQAKDRPAVAQERTAERMERAVAPAERRGPAVEAHQLHGGKHPHEQIGHILVQAEAPAKPQPEKAARQKEVLAEKHYDRLNRAELMALSDKIIIEGSSLRQIYETHLIGERGLRRLVAEHLQGGDLKKALRREVVEREIDFERDPVMRDQPSQMSGGNTGGKAALNDLLQKADNTMHTETEEVKFLKARADYEAKQQAGQQKRQRIMDVALSSAIAVLAAVIIVLIVVHR